MSEHNYQSDREVAEDPFLNYEASANQLSSNSRESTPRGSPWRAGMRSASLMTEPLEDSMYSDNNYLDNGVSFTKDENPLYSPSWPSLADVNVNSMKSNNAIQEHKAAKFVSEKSLEKVSTADNNLVLQELENLRERLNQVELQLSERPSSYLGYHNNLSPYRSPNSYPSLLPSTHSPHSPAPLSTMQTALMRLRTYHPSPIILKPVEQAVNHAITLVNTSPSSVVDALCRSLAELCLGLVQEAIDASILSQQESSNSLDLVRHTPPLNYTSSVDSSPQRMASDSYGRPSLHLNDPFPSVDLQSNELSHHNVRTTLFSDDSRFHSKIHTHSTPPSQMYSAASHFRYRSDPSTRHVSNSTNKSSLHPSPTSLRVSHPIIPQRASPASQSFPSLQDTPSP